MLTFMGMLPIFSINFDIIKNNKRQRIYQQQFLKKHMFNLAQIW